MWEKRISHAGLNAYRVVKGQTQYDVAMKVAAQEAIWEKRWQAHLRAEEARNARETKMLLMWTKSTQTAEAKDMALEQTRDLEEARAKLETILKDSLSEDPTLEWKSLKDFSKFAVPKPAYPPKLSRPAEVNANDALYQPEKTSASLSFFDHLIPSRKRSKHQAADQANEAAKARVAEKLAKDIAEQKDAVAKIDAENLFS